MVLRVTTMHNVTMRVPVDNWQCDLFETGRDMFMILLVRFNFCVGVQAAIRSRCMA